MGGRGDGGQGDLMAAAFVSRASKHARLNELANDLRSILNLASARLARSRTP